MHTPPEGEVFLWSKIMNKIEAFHQNKNIEHDGCKLSNLFEPNIFRSLKLRPDRLRSLENISSVIFVGSSGTGKSHIQRAVISALETDPFLKKICVPQRIVTRPARPDDSKEIAHCSPEELEWLAQNEKIGFYGIKIMENGREEPFGLKKPEEGTLPIFFANNTVVKHPETIKPKSLLENSLIIGMYTPDDQREVRLRRRSPQLFEGSADEAKFRLSEEESSRIVIPMSHVIVKNFGNFEGMVERDVIKLLQLIVLTRERKLPTDIPIRQLRNRYMFLRHGISFANRNELIISQSDFQSDKYTITQEGIEQIKQAAFIARNSKIKIDRIFTSPFARCVDSALTFADEYGFSGDIVTRNELGERYFGIYNGRKVDHYEIIYTADLKSPEESRLYEAETPGDVLKRMLWLIRELESVEQDKTILLVTHADVGEITQAGLKGLPPETHRLFIPKLQYGQLRTIDN